MNWQLTESERAEWDNHFARNVGYLRKWYGEDQTITRMFNSTHRIVRFHLMGDDLVITEVRDYVYIHEDPRQ